MSKEKDFVIADVMPGKLNALVKNIIRQTGVSDANEAVRLVNSGEWVVSKSTRSWREVHGIIYFSVTSDGTSGKDWIVRLGSKSFDTGTHTREILCSTDFKPTVGVTTQVAVLKSDLFGDDERTTKRIRAAGALCKLSPPNAELACLIREKFTDEEIEAMGLWHIVTMHEPISDPDGCPRLLGTSLIVAGRKLLAFVGRPDATWDRDCGFAFAVSSTSVAEAEIGEVKPEVEFGYADFLSDDEIDPQRAEVLRKIGKISDEEFISILEKIAPGNPYVEGLLKAVRDKKIGGAS